MEIFFAYSIGGGVKMIRINLLPQELRVKKESLLPKWFSFNVFSIPIIVLVIMLALDTVLGVMTMWQDAEIKMMTMKKNGLYPKRREQLQLERKLSNYKKMMNNRSSYAQVLNIISDCMPSNAWFYKFSMDEETGILEIKGSFYDPKASKKDKGVVGQFISCMKSKPLIENTFSDISVKGLNQRDIKGTPVVDFSVYCEIKK